MSDAKLLEQIAELRKENAALKELKAENERLKNLQHWVCSKCGRQCSYPGNGGCCQYCWTWRNPSY